MAEAKEITNGSVPPAVPEKPAASHTFNINVVDPVKQDAGGLNPFVTYKVNTTTNHPKFSGAQSSVIRRFKDFAWLNDCLLEEFPGAICPPLPAKATVKKFETDFIEHRRVELEKFLLRVSMHAELRDSESFFTFLQADDATFAKKKGDSTAIGRVTSGQNTSGNEIKRQFGWMVTNLKAQMNQQTSVKMDEDEKVEALNVYIGELEQQVQLLAKHVSHLVKKQEALGCTAYDLGFALTQLAKAERDNESLMNILEQCGKKVDGASITIKLKAQKDHESFDVPINEYVNIIKSVKTAISKRNEKRMLYVQAMSEVQFKVAAHTKLQSAEAKPEKLAAALAAVKTAEEEQEKAKNTYDTVTKRLLTEFERFKKEKAADIQKMLKGFVDAHIECNRLENEHWQQMLTSVGALEGSS